MCTISWSEQPSGLHVLFNRDESKQRSRAEPPQVCTHGAETSVIYPKDPDGGGTWFAVNERGMAVGLLNFYQGRLPKGRLTSRGNIVKEAAALASVDEVRDYIRHLPLEKYAPFSLLCFDHQADWKQVPLLRWTGRELQELTQTSPLISSAFKFEEVQAIRLETYRRLIGDTNTSEAHFLAFHCSHEPEKSAYSVCMHRDDASTVSLSQVIVGERIRYRYWDGAPCEVGTPLEIGF